MELKQQIENILIEELFESSASASAAVIAVKLAPKILSLPEIKEGEQLRRLCYLHDGPGGVSVQMREK